MNFIDMVLRYGFVINYFIKKKKEKRKNSKIRWRVQSDIKVDWGVNY